MEDERGLSETLDPQPACPGPRENATDSCYPKHVPGRASDGKHSLEEATGRTEMMEAWRLQRVHEVQR
ncbi:hypothetical protein U0070_020251 [Myodes glareolus]|uniref:Uncharacterized protein n=1 Tax=Myodes glareolus TaxID=447135 RepID=A0AAW0JET9_MYOGA